MPLKRAVTELSVPEHHEDLATQQAEHGDLRGSPAKKQRTERVRNFQTSTSIDQRRRRETHDVINIALGIGNLEQGGEERCPEPLNDACNHSIHGSKIENRARVDIREMRNNLAETHLETISKSQQTPPVTAPGVEEYAYRPSGYVCFRISNVPTKWRKEDLLRNLAASPYHPVGGQNTGYDIFIFPACQGNRNTAILHAAVYSAPFRNITDDSVKTVDIRDGEDIISLSIDRHFHGFTPLNDPGKNIIADVIAVTGLAGHALGSWRNRESDKVWLRDFLPQDFPNIRIMTYGYNTVLKGAQTSNIKIVDHRRDLIQKIVNARSSPQVRMTDLSHSVFLMHAFPVHSDGTESISYRGATGNGHHWTHELTMTNGETQELARPIIFLGHSLGGIVISQALLQAKNDEAYRKILDKTRAVFFFGVPHSGLRTSELEAMVLDMSNNNSESGMLYLLHQLRECSNFLTSQREDLIGIWDKLKLFTFYETMETPSIRKSEKSGKYERSGELEKIVKEISAVMYLRNERRIPVGRNHTDIVKLPGPTDDTYESIRTYMKDSLSHTKAEVECLLDDHVKCLKSLPSSEFESYRDTLWYKRHDSTCEWLLNDERFKSWNHPNNSPMLLWISGGPGCGKSVLSAFLSKTLPDDTTTPSSFAYFFCDDKDESLRTAQAILANWLAQLLQQMPSLIVHFLHEPKFITDREKTQWSFGMLWTAFERIAGDPDAGNICLLLDALDECEEQSRKELLLRMQNLIGGHHTGTRLKMVITSRPHIPVASHLEDMVLIPLKANDLANDIEIFVNAEIRKLPNLPERLREEIQTALLEGANGMFLWVSLILENLKNLKTTKPRVIQETLKTMPRTIPEVYTKILSQISPGYDRENAQSILRWVVWAKRPLTIQELTISTAIRREATSTSDISNDMETDMKSTISKLFGPMLRTDDGNTVHLVHQSARDYFLSPERACDLSLLDLAVPCAESHRKIAESCITYLCFKGCDIGPIASKEDWKVQCLIEKRVGQLEFLHYGSLYWHEHTKEAYEKGSGQDLWTVFQRLASSLPNINLAYQIRCCFQKFNDETYQPEASFAIAAALGLSHFVAESLKDGATDRGLVHKALLSAARNGDEAMVRLLIEQGVDINQNGGNALSAAVMGGNETIIRLLIDRGADITSNGGDALEKAVTIGSEAIMQLLMKKGVDIRSHGDHARLLEIATQKRNAVNLLLLLITNFGVCVNAQGGYYGGALKAVATLSGDETLTRLLIKEGANVNYQGGGSVFTRDLHPLTMALLTQHWAMARILIEEGVDVTAYGSLCSPARQGDETMVRFLIEKGANVNNGDPLYSAAHKNRHEIVRLLLEKGANADSSAHALMGAAESGNAATVQLLIDEGADVNAQGIIYGSALQAAAKTNRDEVVRLLIENGADVNANGVYGTALMAAAESGNAAMVQLLIDEGADINTQGNFYESVVGNTSWDEVAQLVAEHRAVLYNDLIFYGSAEAGANSDEVVRLLIEEGTKINTQGYVHGTALHAAAAAIDGDENLVRLLINKGADLNAQAGRYGNALQAAAAAQADDGRRDLIEILDLDHDHRRVSMAKQAVVRLLIEQGVDVNIQGGYYGNALQAAAATFTTDKMLVQLFLEKGADVNAQGGHYGNALQAAAAGHYSLEIVRLLIEHGADVNAKGGYFGSCLQAAAARSGDVHLVWLLIDEGADVNAQGGYYGNALRAACRNGNMDAVKVLIEYDADVSTVDYDEAQLIEAWEDMWWGGGDEST